MSMVTCDRHTDVVVVMMFHNMECPLCEADGWEEKIDELEGKVDELNDDLDSVSGELAECRRERDLLAETVRELESKLGELDSEE